MNQSPKVNANSVETSSCSSEPSGASSEAERTTGSSSLPDKRWLVETTGLVQSFREDVPPALDHLETKVAGGAITGLAGPDGAGKTTLMRLLAGLLLPTAGSVRVLGFDPTTQPEEIRSRIGYMPQRFGLYEDLSVIQNLNLYAELRGVIGEARRASFERLLSFTDLKRFRAGMPALCREG
jgi:ABC-2 type transport system ATP-binding protein